MIRSRFFIAAVLVSAFMSLLTVATPVYAEKCLSKHILAYPAWSNGLTCEKGHPKLEDINHTWIIVLNIVQWIIITAGYAAVGYILYGGFRYITAQGEPAAIVEAKNSILHAIIGLVVALGSVMIVRTVQTAILTGSLI